MKWGFRLNGRLRIVNNSEKLRLNTLEDYKTSMRAVIRYLVIASMALSFFALFGGNWAGAWFTIYISEEQYVFEDSQLLWSETSESVTYFKVDEVIFITETKVEGKTEDDSGNIDYEDNNCAYNRSDSYSERGAGGEDCDNLGDLMMGKIGTLLYVQLLAGIAVFYFLNTDDFILEENYDRGEKASVVMAGAGLLALILFFFSFPETLEEDLLFFENLSNVDGGNEDVSFLGSKEWEIGSDSDVITQYAVAWRPSFAPFLILFSISAAVGAYLEIKNGRPDFSKNRVEPKSVEVPLVIPDEFSIVSEEYDDSVDAFEPKDIENIDSFKPKEMVTIKCPGCESQMEIPKLNKMQDVECGSCGLAGEIKK